MDDTNARFRQMVWSRQIKIQNYVYSFVFIFKQMVKVIENEQLWQEIVFELLISTKQYEINLYDS